MYNKNRYIVSKINRYSKFKQYVVTTCISFFIIGILIFSFYIFGNTSQAIKFVSEYKNKEVINKIEKVMTNPSIKYEYDDNKFYDIKATKGVHKNEQEILLFDVYAEGESMNITSGKLLVSNNGNDLHFTENPVLILKTAQTK